MSSGATMPVIPATIHDAAQSVTDPAQTPLRPEPPSRSFVAQVIHDTIKRWGARVGLAWVGLLVLAAVFAPLIASSHPILWKVGGRWSSPMLQHLTPPDVILLV